MRTVRTVNVGNETLIIPVGMGDKELVIFLGTLATMQRVSSMYGKDYNKSFAYATGAAPVSTNNVVLHDSEEAALLQRDVYNSLLNTPELA
jgi:hypothetical protein